MNTQKTLFVILCLGLIFTMTGWSDVGPDMLTPLVNGDREAMRRIEELVTPAAQEGNRVADTIARMARRARGQERTNDDPQWRKPDLHEGTEKDWVAAVEKKATDGDAFFMVVVGALYINGHVVPKDRQQALAWWQKAAETNCGLAKLTMGRCYLNKEVLPRDAKKAAVYFREAGELGNPEGWNILGCLYSGWYGWSPRDLKKAMECWAISAAMGHAWSQYNLGAVYCYGDEELPQNKELGLKWMRVAATNGNTWAKTYLSNYVEKAHVQRTLPAIIEDKNTDVSSTVIAYDKIQENIIGPKVSVLCFVDFYEPETYDPSQKDDKTPSQMLDTYLTGLRAFKKQQAEFSGADAVNAEDVKIFIVESREDTRIKVREFNKQYQVKRYDGSIPVLHVFHLERLVGTYTYDKHPGRNGEDLKLLVEELFKKTRFSFKPRN